MNYFAELKRRNVFKVGIAYLVVAWLVLQLVSVVSPILVLPAWFARAVLVLLIIGLPFALIIAWAFELTPEGIKLTDKNNSTDSPDPHSRRHFNMLLISALVLVIAMTGLNFWLSGEPETTEAPATTVNTATAQNPATDAAEPPTSVADKSIAVLPFTNLSNDPDQEYFSDGLTEELISKLSQVQNLQVTGRSSSFYYKGRTDELQEIGETLGVGHVLQGSVRKSGNQLRISAQLMDARSEFNVWSQTFDRELSDIFSIQDEIAAAVTTALSVTLGAGEFNRPGMTRNVAAYDAYMKGIAFEQSMSFQYQEAIASLQQAVELDPGFTLAWERLARNYDWASGFGPVEQRADFPALKEAALARASALAPQLPVVQLALAQQERLQGNWLDAETILLAQIEQGNGLANYNYGELLSGAGYPEQALPYLLRARRLDPLSADVALTLAMSLNIMGRYEDALDELNRILSVANVQTHNTAESFKAFIAYSRNDRQTARRVIDGLGHEMMMEVAGMLAEGRDNELRERFREIFTGSGIGWGDGFLFGTFASVAGSPETALAAYQIAMTPRGRLGNPGTWFPYFAAMRQLPGFKTLVRESGLPEFWQSKGEWPEFCQPLPGGDDFECI